MNFKKTKQLSIIILIVIFACGKTAAQTKQAWRCGANAIATFNGSTLSISGEGRLNNFGTWGENTPWENYRNDIKEVKITGVTSIPPWGFANCKNLTTVTIPKTITTIGSNAFSECKGLTSIIIPHGVVSIGARAFTHCTNLTSIKLHNSITSIGEYAFGKCSALTSIVIPSGVAEIGNCIFSDCHALTSITIYRVQPPLLKGESILNKDAPNFSQCILYVPRGAVEAYKKADGWKDFGDIREMP